MFPVIIGIVILTMASIFLSTKVSTKTQGVTITTPPGPTVVSDKELGDTETDVTDSPTPSPSAASSTSSPKLADTTQPQSSTELKYPNSTDISTDGNSKTYESQDNPDSITNWYKDQITAKNLNVKNFVTTKNNDNVLNKLEGTNGSYDIKVEISKGSGDSKTKIVVSITRG